MTTAKTISTCYGADAPALEKTVAGDADRADLHPLKELVKDRYARAATEKSGCGCGCGRNEPAGDYSFVGEKYTGREGYEEIADLGLGCGVPTDIAGLQEGDTVLDLGSGAGIDAFIAATHVGETGEVIGVDFTPGMIQRARANAKKLEYPNVRFVLGDIEDLPLPQRSVDVVISNCVLNLVPDKRTAFAEMYRVLKPGGHFTISDLVLLGSIPGGGCSSPSLSLVKLTTALVGAMRTDMWSMLNPA